MNIKQSEQLSEFVKLAISKGLKQKDIEAMLLAKGWPKEVVDTLFISKCSPRGLLISVRDLTKSFGDSVILDRISFDVYSGELFGIIGLSGSGKSTLLNLLVGYMESDNGYVYLHLPIKDNPELIPQMTKNNIGFSCQHPSFHPSLTVLENMTHYATLYNLRKKEQKNVCNELMRELGLFRHQDTRASDLSGGMQKRLDIACALIHNPKILILDEPTSDIDPLARKEVWNLIKRINRSGTTVIVASHFLEELEKHCSKLAILHKRKILKSGTPEQIRKFYSVDFEVHLETKSRRYKDIIKELRKKSLGISHISRADRKLIVFTKKPKETAHALTHLITKAHLVDLTVERPKLKTIFESIMKYRRRWE